MAAARARRVQAPPPHRRPGPLHPSLLLTAFVAPQDPKPRPAPPRLRAPAGVAPPPSQPSPAPPRPAAAPLPCRRSPWPRPSLRGSWFCWLGRWELVVGKKRAFGGDKERDGRKKGDRAVSPIGRCGKRR
ncbi:hypothetical protein BRADI_2g38978v3 [Brachypodium distachyon]|uniref:Uncharacterized protein n=1 Tax=Brachypodium distachyon TaxID=15368 RepID=A0A0Q3IQ78_BRADI|nr:hypothetical protein BRADI_2g38978v3 [Brachypodium distachyon]PNT72075.1 hypothetical protein BRADI_2g38978v3 [Brachypodium distachyon]